MITLRMNADIKDDRKVILTLPDEVPTGKAELVVTVESPAVKAPRPARRAGVGHSRHCRRQWLDSGRRDNRKVAGGTSSGKTRMKQYLFDTSVLLDLLLNRLPWASDAATLWDAHRQGQIRAIVSAFSLPTIFYIVRKQSGIPVARNAVQACLATLDIAPTDQTTLLRALALGGPDFEDDLQIAGALQAGVDAIVTRDSRGFAASTIPVLSPAVVVASLSGPTTP